MRQTDFLDNRPYVRVDDESTPGGVGGAGLGVGDGRISLGEGEVQSVEHRDWECGEDEVELEHTSTMCGTHECPRVQAVVEIR